MKETQEKGNGNWGSNPRASEERSWKAWRKQDIRPGCFYYMRSGKPGRKQKTKNLELGESWKNEFDVAVLFSNVVHVSLLEL